MALNFYLRNWVVCGLLSGFAAPSLAQTNLEVLPSPISGIELIGPSQAGFEGIVEKLVPGPGSRTALEPVLPYSVAVHNSAERTVVCYTIRFDYSANGRPAASVLTRDYRTSEPKLVGAVFHLIAPLGAVTQAIATGGSPLLPQDPSYPALMKRIHDLRQSPRVVASLDSVVYEGGEFVGPDVSGSFESINAKTEISSDR